MRVTIKAARVNAGLTQKSAAKALKVSVKSIINWENGVSCPRADRLCEICNLYKCEPSDIIFLPKDCS